mgnify:CR=1 FL=1
MAPNTATALKESKKNQLKDFVNVAGPLGVTHFLILTATHNASYLRIAKWVVGRGRPAGAAVGGTGEGEKQRLTTPTMHVRLCNSARPTLPPTRLPILTPPAPLPGLCRAPRGPTLTMRIHEYSLIRDVVAAQQRPRTPQAMWLGPPLVVLNNFSAGAPRLPPTPLLLLLVWGPASTVADAACTGCQLLPLLLLLLPPPPPRFACHA